MPLAVDVFFVLFVAAVLVVSLIKFSAHASGSPLQLSGAAASFVLLVMMSIQYGRSIGRTLSELGSTVSSGDSGRSTIGEPAGRWISNAGSWMADYTDWWLEHLPGFIGTVNVNFEPGFAPLLILGFAYAVRAGIYRYLKDAQPKVHEYTSAYWAHITLFLVSLAFLSSVYSYSVAQLVIVVGLMGIFLVIFGTRIVTDVARAMIELMASVRHPRWDVALLSPGQH